MTAIQMALLAASGGRPPEALTNTFTTSDGKWAVGDSVTFNKGQGDRAFPVRNGTIFRIALYGAGGGDFSGATGATGGNANGGILDANINLSSYQNTNLTIVTGGGGANSNGNIDGCDGFGSGGYNGGGYGQGSRGPGGGGRTDLRTQATDQTTELLVAGGGGGGFGTLGTSGRYYGDNGCGGMFGDYCGDNAGGGSGYLGGQASCSDDGSNGGSGTNYYNPSLTTSVITDTRISGQAGGNSGAGYFTIVVVGVA
jgi:hypothetical protein